MREFSVAGRKIGDAHPSFIVAEMSGNHNGRLELALEIVRQAAIAGADAIKLQTYRADTITLNSTMEDFVIPAANPWSSHSTLFDLYEKAHTPWDWHEPIFNEAKKLGLIAFSAPFDESAVDLLEKLGAPLYKIASPEITHIPLLKRVARTGKPVIISTGVAELADIELAVATLREGGCRDLVVLKCSTAYPAPVEETNLRTIADMKTRFECLSGLSDHSLGYEVPVLAVASGANLIEKHFTIEEAGETVDSFFSLAADEFKKMVQAIRQAEKVLGKIDYTIPPSARENIRGRRSLYIARAVRAGEKLTAENIKSVRPSFGLHPKYYEQVIGTTAARDLQAGERLSWDAVQK